MKAKKSLGQNFLIDENILNQIIKNICATENDLVIEIGPGRGALTKKLQEKNLNILCYEIDKDLKIFLDKISNEKTKIIYNDILLTNIKEDIKNIKYENLYIVGNLPYYITTPILKHLINSKINIKEIIIMVQEEVADRFSALPKSKNYGSMTLFLKYYFNVIKLFKVSKNSFYPKPKVESAILKLEKRIDKPIVNEEDYFKLINDAFKMKRKTLKNNLSNYDLATIDNVLSKYNLPNTVRAEELDENIFVEIFNNIKRNK